MFVLKGFVEHALLINSTIGTISDIGQLSTQSMTYAKNKDFYISAIDNDLNLVIFTSASDNVKVKLTSAQADHVATIAKYIYDHTISSSVEYSRTELLNLMYATLSNVGDSFECGEFISDLAENSIPAWVSWHSKDTSVTDTNNIFKLWFCDSSFQEQYDDYEIVVVPPFDILDNFFLPPNTVKKNLALITPADSITKLQTAKGNNPETIIRAEVYGYVNPFVNNEITDTTWSFLIYGIAGDNIDAINDALINYILANTTKTKDDWIKIFPDIFKHTEFIIIPMWNQYAIPERVLEKGIYSPVVKWKTSVVKAKAIAVDYNPVHIENYLDIVHQPYKSLAMLVIGCPDNKNSKYELTDYFSDYIAIQSTSDDFTRMSVETQGWCSLLERLLVVAEEMTKYSSIPSNMTRVMRNDILFISARYNKINYLVAAKSTMLL